MINLSDAQLIEMGVHSNQLAKTISQTTWVANLMAMATQKQ